MASAGAIRAGSAFVELFTDKSRMVSGLKSAEKDFKNWGSKITSIGAGLSVASAAVTAPMFLATTAFAAAGSELNDMSARTGASVESLSLLKFAAEQTGSDFAAVGIGVKGLDNKLADAVGGNKAAQDSFARLGLSAGKLATMSVEDQFAAIAEGLQGISNPALRASAAQDIFGKSGMALLPMLKDGSSGLKKLTDRGKEVGAMWTGDMATSADDLGDRMDELKTTGMSLAFAVGGALAPVIMELSEPIFAIAAGTREWIAANPGVIQTVALVAAGVGAAGVAITGLGLTISAAGVAFGGLATAITAVASPIGLMVAGLTGIGYLIVTETDIGSEAFNSLASTATTTWGGITDAVASGDLGLAAEVALAGLNVVWQQGVATVLDTWTVASTAILQQWNDITAAMQGVGENLYAYFATMWVDIKGFAFDAMNSIASKWDAVSGGIADVIIDVSVSTGLMKGDAEEIKANRREDTARRQKPRDDSLAVALEQRAKKRQDIEGNRLDGVGGIKTEQGQRADQLQSEQDAALMASEKAKADAQLKLQNLTQDAANKADDVAEAKAEAAAKKADDELERKKLADEAGKNSEVAGKAEEDALKKEKDSHDHKVGDVTASGLVSSMNRAVGLSGVNGEKSAAGNVAPVANPFARTPEQLAAEKAATDAAAVATVANANLARTSTPRRVEAARIANEKAAELEAQTPAAKMNKQKATDFGNFMQRQFGELPMPGGMPGLEGGMPADAGGESKSEDVTLLTRVVEVLESLDQRVASGNTLTA